MNLQLQDGEKGGVDEEEEDNEDAVVRGGAMGEGGGINMKRVESEKCL